MANVHVRRGSQLSGSVRNLKVFVDGTEVGAVKRNETVMFAIDPGDHDVYVKMDWVRSPALTITATDGSNVHLLAVLPEHRLQAFKSLLQPRKGLTLRHE